MKKTIACFVACLVFGVASSFAGEPVKNTGDEPVRTGKMLTFKELKIKYGDNLVVESGTYQDDDLIELMNVPAPEDCHGIPCDAAIRTGVAKAQKQANECCCSFAVGILCCDNGPYVEYLILIEPTVACP